PNPSPIYRAGINTRPCFISATVSIVTDLPLTAITFLPTVTDTVLSPLVNVAVCFALSHLIFLLSTPSAVAIKRRDPIVRLSLLIYGCGSPAGVTNSLPSTLNVGTLLFAGAAETALTKVINITTTARIDILFFISVLTLHIILITKKALPLMEVLLR